MELLVSNLSGSVRRESLHGRQYLVAPVTMIVPGVLNGNRGPGYYPLDEIEATADAWNNMPILLGHPKSGSGRKPAIIEEFGLGNVFNTVIDGKLAAEAWFDVENTRRLSPQTLAAVERGDKIEVSTGLGVGYENTAGVYNGTAYTWIARNHKPDHLAVLVDEKGACSIGHGCGVNNTFEGHAGRPGQRGGSSPGHAMSKEAHNLTGSIRGLQSRTVLAKSRDAVKSAKLADEAEDIAVETKHRERAYKAHMQVAKHLQANGIGPQSRNAEDAHRKAAKHHLALLNGDEPTHNTADKQTMWQKLGEMLGIANSFPGHAGRPGHRGGSVPKGEGGASPEPKSTKKENTYESGEAVKPTTQPKHLTALLKSMALDNEMEMLPVKSRKFPSNVAELEKQAAKLSNDDKEVFAAGEHTEVQALARKLGIQDLNNYLNEAFDGAHTDHLFTFSDDVDNSEHKQTIWQNLGEALGIANSFPGHKGRKGQRGGSAPAGEGGGTPSLHEHHTAESTKHMNLAAEAANKGDYAESKKHLDLAQQHSEEAVKHINSGIGSQKKSKSTHNSENSEGDTEVTKLTPEQKTAVVNELITNCACSGFEEKDRPTLNAMEDDMLTKCKSMMGKVKNTADTEKKLKDQELILNSAKKGIKVGDTQFTLNEKGEWVQAKEEKKEEEKVANKQIKLEDLPAEMQEDLKFARNAKKQYRNGLIERLVANVSDDEAKKKAFTVYNKMSTEELEVIAPAVQNQEEDDSYQPSYWGQAAGVTNAAADKKQQKPMAPFVYNFEDEVINGKRQTA